MMDLLIASVEALPCSMPLKQAVPQGLVSVTKVDVDERYLRAHHSPKAPPDGGRGKLALAVAGLVAGATSAVLRRAYAAVMFEAVGGHSRGPGRRALVRARPRPRGHGGLPGGGRRIAANLGPG
jgi:hypothetical protein